MKILGRNVISVCCFLFIVYFIIGCVLPFFPHKRAGNTLKDTFRPQNCYASVEGAERVLCIDDNMEALVWRIRIIESAQNEIILSTFDFAADSAGLDMMSALLHAAQRNVHIRILVDGINGMLNLSGNNYFRALRSHPNIEVKLYNTINLIKPWKCNFRMHDKYLMADDTVYILGGRNTNDLFLGDNGHRTNADRDLLIYQTGLGGTDTSVFQLKSYFEAIWELPCNKTMSTIHIKRTVSTRAFLGSRYQDMKIRYPAAFEQTDFTSATIATNKVTLLTNPKEPVNREPELWYMLHQLMLNRQEVVIQTPYVICSDDMYADLTTVCNSTDVQIITNAVESGANPWGCTDYLNQKKKILQTGATVHEYVAQCSSHTKTILLDDRISIVGSYNLDMRSTYLNTEIMLVIDGAQLNQSLRTCADENKQQSRQVYPDGSYEYGTQHTHMEMPLCKKMFYSVLRIIIMPFRHLL